MKKNFYFCEGCALAPSKGKLARFVAVGPGEQRREGGARREAPSRGRGESGAESGADDHEPGVAHPLEPNPDFSQYLHVALLVAGQ